MTPPLLSVDKLNVRFDTEDGIVRAVNDVSFHIRPGETLGIVGESGSGKSVTSLAIMGLIPTPPGRIESGRAFFQGSDLLQMPPSQLASMRGNRIAMIFQDPMTSLNPFLSVGEQLTEVTRHHLGHSRREAVHHAIEMLEKVGIPAAAKRINDFPHEFSGGMRQRVMIAIALSCKPDLLIADEPTTALDVTIQSQILELMETLQHEEGTAIILITHDLGIVAGACDRVNVMYGGRIVEESATEPLFADPRHPYTMGLLQSVPRVDEQGHPRLTPIDGQPPDMSQPIEGCAFAPRCPYRLDKCQEQPPLFDVDGSEERRFACFADVAKATVAK